MLQLRTAHRTPLSHICTVLSIFICVPMQSSRTVPKTLEKWPHLQSPSPLALVPYYHLVPAPHAFVLRPRGSGSGYSKRPASPTLCCAPWPVGWVVSSFADLGATNHGPDDDRWVDGAGRDASVRGEERWDGL